MTITRVRPPLDHRMIAAGSALLIAVIVTWMSATAFGQGTSAKRPLAPAQVLVSVGTLDMSRLVPSQFGDWDAAPAQPAR